MSFIRKSQCSLFDVAAPSGLCSARQSDFPRELHPLTTYCLWNGASIVLSPPTTTRGHARMGAENGARAIRVGTL